MLLHTLNFVFEQTQVWPSGLDSAMIVTEVGAVGTFWLVFLPPQAYRSWVNGDRLFSTAPSN